MGVFSGWIEGILLSIAFISVFTFALVSLNSDYNQNYATPFTTNETMANLTTYQESAETQISNGNVINNGVIGVNIVQSYNLLKGVGNIIWNFLSGGFLQNLADMLNIGQAGYALMGVFRIIWVFGIIFGFLYIFFKVIV